MPDFKTTGSSPIDSAFKALQQFIKENSHYFRDPLENYCRDPQETDSLIPNSIKIKIFIRSEADDVPILRGLKQFIQSNSTKERQKYYPSFQIYSFHINKKNARELISALENPNWVQQLEPSDTALELPEQKRVSSPKQSTANPHFFWPEVKVIPKPHNPQVDTAYKALQQFITKYRQYLNSHGYVSNKKDNSIDVAIHFKKPIEHNPGYIAFKEFYYPDMINNRHALHPIYETLTYKISPENAPKLIKIVEDDTQQQLGPNIEFFLAQIKAQVEHARWNNAGKKLTGAKTPSHIAKLRAAFREHPQLDKTLFMTVADIINDIEKHKIGRRTYVKKLYNFLKEELSTIEKSLPIEVDSDENNIEKSLPLEVDSDENNIEKSLPLEVDSDENNIEKSLPLEIDSDENNIEMDTLPRP